MAVLLKDPKDMGEVTHLKTHRPSKILKDFIHLLHKVISFDSETFNGTNFE
jgi:hypothetical protein